MCGNTNLPTGTKNCATLQTDPLSNCFNLDDCPIGMDCKLRPHRFDNSNRTYNFKLICQDSGWVRGSSQGLISEDLVSPVVLGKDILVRLPGVDLEKNYCDYML